VYTDWFLPSKQELDKVYYGVGNGGTGTNSNGDSNVNIANMYSAWYWSSSESTLPWGDPTIRAIVRDFSANIGYSIHASKALSIVRSRSVRYF